VGAKKKPFYRIVVTDSRSPRDGRNLENVGTYDPNPEPPAIRLNAERIQHWYARGAKPSETVSHLFKRAGLQLTKA
jgi:small subunit ribosomal protein S16